MLNKIKNVPNQKLIDLEYLKNSNLPLLLYGTGAYAVAMKSFLDTHNIKPDYIVSDTKFFLPDSYFEGFPIQSIDDVISQYSSVNVIIAFYECFEKMAKYSSHQQVSRCILFDAVYSQDHFYDYHFIEEHRIEFECLYNTLEDEHSKEVLIAFINAKISGCLDDLYDLNIKGEKQYFPSFLQLSESEIFVDCGAYDGDTIISFNNITNGKYNKIYAFECDNINVEKLKRNVSNYKNIEIFEKGCFSEKTFLSFSNEGSEASKIEKDGTFQIEVDTIDNIVLNHTASFIKMDIEGAELEALKGAKNTIIRSMPKLAISIYHKPEDLITIPQYILSLNKSYKIYLRNHRYMSFDTVLYAI
jgi:FkbM family methyltransferase